jgi:hypothetical protein
MHSIRTRVRRAWIHASSSLQLSRSAAETSRLPSTTCRIFAHLRGNLSVICIFALCPLVLVGQHIRALA